MLGEISLVNLINMELNKLCVVQSMMICLTGD